MTTIDPTSLIENYKQQAREEVRRQNRTPNRVSPAPPADSTSHAHIYPRR